MVRLLKNATDFSLYLLEAALVATVTGDAFGNPNCIRIRMLRLKIKLLKRSIVFKKAVS